MEILKNGRFEFEGRVCVLVLVARPEGGGWQYHVDTVKGAAVAEILFDHDGKVTRCQPRGSSGDATAKRVAAAIAPHIAALSDEYALEYGHGDDHSPNGIERANAWFKRAARTLAHDLLSEARVSARPSADEGVDCVWHAAECAGLARDLLLWADRIGVGCAVYAHTDALGQLCQRAECLRDENMYGERAAVAPSHVLHAMARRHAVARRMRERAAEAAS